MDKQVKLIDYNRSREVLSPIGIVIHETATPGATAENEYKYFNSGNRRASAHGFVDWNEYIQTIPYNEVAWHAGHTANHKYIGIEICHAKNKSDFDKAWENAVNVITEIMQEYNFTINDITTHNNVSNIWHESDHTDPIGYFKKFGKTWEDFKTDVKNKIYGGLTMTQYKELKNEISTLSKTVKFLEGELYDLKNPMHYNYIDDNMPEWARDAVRWCAQNGIIKGDGDGLALDDKDLRYCAMIYRMGGEKK